MEREHAQVTVENILNREFEVSRPHEVWRTDVAEIEYPGKAQKNILVHI